MSWETVYRQGLWENKSDCPELEEILSLTGGETRTIMDVGCSFGRLAVPLARLGFRVRAVDVVKEPLDKLSELSTQVPTLSTHLCHSRQLPFASASVDGCLAVNSIYHGLYQDVKESLGEISRVLRPFGWLYGTFLSTDDWKFGVGERLEPSTFVSVEGPDPDVPHWFATRQDVMALFTGWRVHQLQLSTERRDRRLSAHWTVVAFKS